MGTNSTVIYVCLIHTKNKCVLRELSCQSGLAILVIIWITFDLDVFFLKSKYTVMKNCFVAAQALERMMSPVGPSPNPNVPSEYCSTIPPLQQAWAAGTLNSPPPTVMVPVSVLKHPNPDGAATPSYLFRPSFSPMTTFTVPLFRLSPGAKARVVC